MGEVTDLPTQTNNSLHPSHTVERLLQNILFEMRSANEKLSGIETRMEDIDQRIKKLELNPLFSRMFGGKRST